MADTFPKASEPPDSSNASVLLPLLDAFATLLDLATPNATYPAPETILDPLSLDGAPLSDESGGYRCATATGNTLRGQHTTLYESLGRRPVRQAAGQANGDQVPSQTTRDLCRVREEDVAGDQLRKRGP